MDGHKLCHVVFSDVRPNGHELRSVGKQFADFNDRIRQCISPLADQRAVPRADDGLPFHDTSFAIRSSACSPTAYFSSSMSRRIVWKRILRRAIVASHLRQPLLRVAEL